MDTAIHFLETTVIIGYSIVLVIALSSITRKIIGKYGTVDHVSTARRLNRRL